MQVIISGIPKTLGRKVGSRAADGVLAEWLVAHQFLPQVFLIQKNGEDASQEAACGVHSGDYYLQNLSALEAELQTGSGSQ